METARWTQVLVVALAAVVAVVPAFAQVSYTHAVPVPQIAPVLPSGEEVTDAELAQVDGKEVLLTTGFILAFKLANVVKWAAVAGTVASTTIQKGCQRAAEATISLTKPLTMSGVSFSQQHPLATRMVGSGIASAGLTAAQGGSLLDVFVAGASGALGGGAGHAVGKLPIAQQNPLLAAATTGFVTGAGFEAIYRSGDPSNTMPLRDVSVAGLGRAAGSLGVDLLLLVQGPRTPLC